MQPTWKNFENPHLDAEGNALFVPELRALIARNFDRVYPKLKARQFIPVNTSINAGADTIRWVSYDAVGVVDLVSSDADDIPYSDIRGEQNFSIVRTIGGAYRVTLDEVNAFLFEGRPLPEWKARIVRENYERAIDRLAAVGDTKSGLVGLLTIPNATVVTIANGASTYKTWATKTAQEMVNDIISVITTLRSTTNGVEDPNQVILPETQYTLAATTRYGELSEISVLGYLQRAFPGVAFDSWLRAKGAGASGTDRMVVYTKDPEHLELFIPKELQALAPQQVNFTTKVPHHGRYGGVIPYRPLSIAYADGI